MSIVQVSRQGVNAWNLSTVLLRDIKPDTKPSQLLVTVYVLTLLYINHRKHSGRVARHITSHRGTERNHVLVQIRSQQPPSLQCHCMHAVARPGSRVMLQSNMTHFVRFSASGFIASSVSDALHANSRTHSTYKFHDASLCISLRQSRTFVKIIETRERVHASGASLTHNHRYIARRIRSVFQP